MTFISRQLQCPQLAAFYRQSVHPTALHLSPPLHFSPLFWLHSQHFGLLTVPDSIHSFLVSQTLMSGVTLLRRGGNLLCSWQENFSPHKKIFNKNSLNIYYVDCKKVDRKFTIVNGWLCLWYMDRQLSDNLRLSWCFRLSFLFYLSELLHNECKLIIKF